MGELVLHDAAGEFLLVHGSDDFLSLARRPTATGDVPLVRFAPQHGPIVAAALEVVLAEPHCAALMVRVGSDEMRFDMVERPGGWQVRVANLSRRRPGSAEPELLELDRAVVKETIAALRGPRLQSLAPARGSVVFHDRAGRVGGVEAGVARTVVSARTQRTWARASFPTTVRRTVAACLATVVANPGDSAIRVAHVARGADNVLVERVATAIATQPFAVANARPGRPARPSRSVPLSAEMAAWVVRVLARDDELLSLEEGSVDVDPEAFPEDVEVAPE